MTTLLTRPQPAERTATTRPAPRRRRRALAPITVGVFSLLVSLAGNWIPALWYDEAATVVSATRTWSQLFNEVTHVDAVHAAYYSFMHVVFSIFGYSPFTLRLPSALAIGVAAALLVVLVRMIADTRLAIISGIIFAVIPRVAWSGGEGRSYAISELLAVALTLALVMALHRDRPRWWVVYGIAVVVSTTVFIYLALIVLAHGITVLVLRNRALSPAIKQGRRHNPGRHWLIATVSAVVVLTPFAVIVRTQGGQLSWITPLSHDTVSSVLLTQWFWKSPGLAVIAWTLIVAAIVLLVVRRRRSTLSAVALPALVFPTVALLVLSATYLPVYSPRYLTMCAPFVAVAMAVPLTLLRSRWLQVIALVVIAAFAVPNLIAERAPEAKEVSSWSKVAHRIQEERALAAPDAVTDIIYGPLRHHILATTRTIEYSYPAAFAGTVDVTLKKPAALRAALWETHHPLADELPVIQSADVVYLITSVKQDRRQVTAADLAAIGWHQTNSWHYRNVNVVQYKFTPVTTPPIPAP